MTEQPSRLASVGEAPVARQQLEAALFEIKRVIVGQEGMLERVLVALLSGGHLLLEGVPGLAKTRTIATLAQVLGGSFQRIQFTPDLVPSDLVGTRIWRPDQGGFETELGPVFCNFLLADEINRAPAKVQSALLEVMQEHQVTIGKKTWPVPAPFLVLATQNPIESDGTYPLPEAQVDRFLMKVVVDYPNFSEEMTIVARSLVEAPTITKILSLEQLQALQAHTTNVYVDRLVAEYAVALCDATRHPATYHLPDLAGLHRLWGQPPRLDQPGRGRPRPGRAPGPQLLPAPRRPGTGPRRPAPPAGADLPGVGRAGHRRQPPHRRPQRHPTTPHRPRTRTTRMNDPLGITRTPDRPGPGPTPEALLRALDVVVRRRIEAMLTGDHRSSTIGIGTELAQIRLYQPGDDVRRIDWAVTARTGDIHVRDQIAERALVSWLVLDTSPSMTFGTADRRKADVAEGVALAVGHVGTRHGNRLGLITFGDAKPVTIPSRQGRAGLLGMLATVRREPQLEGGGATSLGEALARTGRLATSRSLVFVVSDFRGPRDWRRELIELAGRHDVVAVEIRDPREQELPDVGELWLVDPETGRQLRVDTSRRRLRERFASAAATERAELAALLQSSGADHVVLWTAGDWLRSFAGFLRHRVTGPGGARGPAPVQWGPEAAHAGGSAEVGAVAQPGPGAPVTTGGPPGPGSPYARPGVGAPVAGAGPPRPPR